jgi:hypothetical protein
MPDKPWKRREREAAHLFGCHRQICSGIRGRTQRTEGDTDHPRLFIEVKHYARQAVRTLWRETALKASKEKKTAVLVLYEKGKPGGLIVVHEDDLDALLRERQAAVQRAFDDTLNDEFDGHY